MIRRGNPFRALWIRGLQIIARYIPGSRSVRVWLHRMRGVRIGEGVFIGTDVLIDTAMPDRVSIGKGSVIGIRSIIIAHFDAANLEDDGGGRYDGSVRIEDDVFIGPGVIILPNVKIGYGAVVTAGSVVSRSVPRLTMVQGNPAVPIARCKVPLGQKTPLWKFYRSLEPLDHTVKKKVEGERHDTT